MLNKQGVRRFMVWSRFQLHGDDGERIGLQRKVSAKEWGAMISRDHGNDPARDSKEEK